VRGVRERRLACTNAATASAPTTQQVRLPPTISAQRALAADAMASSGSKSVTLRRHSVDL
jgi:hypothetical protein